jgi:hypothetical protein
MARCTGRSRWLKQVKGCVLFEVQEESIRYGVERNGKKSSFGTYV